MNDFFDSLKDIKKELQKEQKKAREEKLAKLMGKKTEEIKDEANKDN